VKVLFWAELFPPSWLGGVELFGLQLIHRLQGAGVDVEVVCDHGMEPLPPVMEHEGIRVSRFPMRAALMSRDFRRIRVLVEGLQDLFRRFQPDLVHVNTLQLGAFLYLRVPERRNCKLLLTLHDPPGEPLNQGALPQALAREADTVVAITAAVQRDFQKAFPQNRSRQRLILNGLEPLEDCPHPLPPGPLRLFSAGRLVRDKGFDLVPQALALLKDTSLHWTLAGDGAEEIALRLQCQQLGLGHQVDFPGRIPWRDVYREMDKAHLVIMPSRWKEPFGLVALQAAQRGRPVIASRIGGLPEVIADGESGLLFEAENVGELVALINQVSRDRETLGNLGRAACERASTFFSMETSANHYHSLYMEMLAT